MQFPVSLIQSFHAVIAWRNLNFFQPQEKHIRFRSVLFLFFLSAAATTLAFVAQEHFFNDWTIDWMRAPQSFGFENEAAVVPLALHIVGVIGLIAYSLRFWVQWLQSEKNQKSELTEAFWQLSLFGALLSCAYFAFLLDWVNAIGPLIALIPYFRNVWLIHKRNKIDAQKTQGSPQIFIFAGEASADICGAKLIEQMRSKFPNSVFWGVGGPSMQKEGHTSLLPFSRFQVMGFSDVIKKFFSLWKAFSFLQKAIITNKPDLVLFIDSPSFGIRLAKKIRNKRFQGKIVQLVAPTVWAYGKERATEMAEHFNLLLTLFSFEPAYFSKTSLKTVFIGHPLLEILPKSKHLLESKHLPELENLSNSAKKLVAIFPGSRPGEVQRNLTKQLKAASFLCQKFPDFELAISLSATQDLPSLQAKLNQMQKKYSISCPIHLIPFKDRYELMQKSYVALAKSGTVTLELALFAVPTVVTYELSWLNYQMAKHVLKLNLPHYCIVNILSNQELFFELIKPPVTAEQIFEKLQLLYSDESLRRKTKEACMNLKPLLLKDKMPSILAAEEICELIKKA